MASLMEVLTANQNPTERISRHTGDNHELRHDEVL
jgi:hypothetical protein